ncbi:MAG: LPXTG cell wall anchor domain-containing protein [Catenulispora sp.]
MADFSALFTGAAGGTETAGPGLPDTGRNLLAIALVGVGLVVVGAGAVILARRRKT